MSANKMRLVFPPKVCAQMLRLVAANSDEVAWHGTVDRTSDSEFTVDEILLYPQRAAANEVRTDEGEYAAWLASLPDDVFGRLRFHAHSHVNMPVTPSPTDLEQQASLVKQLSGEDFYIFMIVNKRFEAGVWIHDLKTGGKYGGPDIEAVIMNGGTVKAAETAGWDVKKPVSAGDPAETAEDKGDMRNVCADGHGMVSTERREPAGADRGHPDGRSFSVPEAVLPAYPSGTASGHPVGSCVLPRIRAAAIQNVRGPGKGDG